MSLPNQIDLFTGEVRVDPVLKIVERAEAVSAGSLIAAGGAKRSVDVVLAAIQKMPLDRPFSTNEVRYLMIHEGAALAHLNAIGAGFNLASRRGLIKLIGFERAKGKESHGRTVKTWCRIG